MENAPGWGVFYSGRVRLIERDRADPNPVTPVCAAMTMQFDRIPLSGGPLPGSGWKPVRQRGGDEMHGEREFAREGAQQAKQSCYPLDR